jgi:hypothetical protein
MDINFNDVVSPCLLCSQTWGGHDYSCGEKEECKYYLTELLLKNILQLSKDNPIDLKLEYKKHFDESIWE